MNKQVGRTFFNLIKAAGVFYRSLIDSNDKVCKKFHIYFGIFFNFAAIIPNSAANNTPDWVTIGFY
jgi:hypothetical protein